jgi:hypothetical protein
MHHYEGELTLRPTSEGGRATGLRSGIRPHVRLGGELFDAQVDLLGPAELSPGERALVGVTFLSPDLVHAQVRIGDVYPVLEGTREIGKLTVRSDVWTDPIRAVEVGRDYAATVTAVGWTIAEVTLENAWTAPVRSADVGLAPWAEIGTSLHEGDRLRVRVEAVDVKMRSVRLSVQKRSESAG